jgi:pentafunctional AROM polypeptide
MHGSAKPQLDPLKPDVLKVSILGKESIHVGFHLIPYMVHTILKELPSTTYMVVTDTNLGSIYLPSLAKEFHAQAGKLNRPDGTPAPRLLNYEIPPGEGAKSRKQKELIEDYMLDNKCLRDTIILALGGGVVGDLTGYVAAT